MNFNQLFVIVDTSNITSSVDDKVYISYLEAWYSTLEMSNKDSTFQIIPLQNFIRYNYEAGTEK